MPEGIERIGKYKIYKDKYYIIDFSNLMDVKVLNFYFLNRRAAQIAVEENFRSKKRKYYAVVKGSKLTEEIRNNTQRKIPLFTKYSYPVDKVTMQERKTFRTVMRRRLRRMGIYTKVRPRKNIATKPDYIKHIPNKQKVANSPNTVAKVIQIQRKNPKYYYLILGKEKSTKKGMLFILNCLRFDNNSGKLKQVMVNVKRTDLLIPYLIYDLEDLIHKKIQQSNNHEYYNKFGFKMVESKKK